MIIYTPETGAVYDTIFFITTYLFEDGMKMRMIPYSKNTDHDLRFFYELKSCFSDIPKSISAFFYCDESVKCFFINFFNHNFNFGGDTINSFINYLNRPENKDIIKKSMIEWYFPDKIESSASLNVTELYNVIEESSFSEEQKKDFYIAFLSLDVPLKWLSDTLVSVYNSVIKLHQKYEYIWNEMKNGLDDENGTAMNKLCMSLFNETKNKEDIVSFSFSLLNPYNISCKKNKTICILIGKKYLNVIENRDTYNFASPLSFGKVISTETRFDILKLFMEYGELCAADISHIMDISKTNVLAYLDSMCSQKMIILSSVEGRRHYYKLDADYLITVGQNILSLGNKEKTLQLKGERTRYDLPKRKRKANDNLTEKFFDDDAD